MSGQAFTSAAAFYSLFAEPEGRLDREGPFLAELLHRAPGSRVLDLACGSGLHAEFFATHGASVDAFDLSPEMTAEAGRLHPHPRVAYQTGDMRTVSGGPWDLAVCLGNSLSLLPGAEDLATAFGAVSHVLAPGGFFATQTLNYSLPAFREPRQRIERRSVGDSEVVAVKNLVPHHDRTLLAITYFADNHGRIESLADSAVLRRLDRAILEKTAISAGFAVENVYGGYNRSPFDTNSSPDIVCVFRKPQDQ